MPRNNRENILLDYAFISLIAQKIKVIIIGGGQGGYIKAKSFLQKGYNVSIVSKEFDQRFKILGSEVCLIQDIYKTRYILDKHLVIIATDDDTLNASIKEDCEKSYKVYLDSSNFREGQFITPVEIKSDNIKVGLHTSVGSPKTSVFLGKKLKGVIDEYDDFVEYIGNLRNNILKVAKNRKLNLEIMNFVNSDDFYFYYRKGKHELILKLFWRDYFDF